MDVWIPGSWLDSGLSKQTFDYVWGREINIRERNGQQPDLNSNILVFFAIQITQPDTGPATININMNIAVILTEE